MMTGAQDELVIRVGSMLRRSGEQRDQVFDVCFDDLVVLESRVPSDAPIHLEAHLESLNEGVVLRGTLEFTWEGQCRRCLKPVAGSAHLDVHEIFVRDPVEGETRALEGDQIDLEPVVRDAALLELPLAPLCRLDCAGLCPKCGADGNIAPCSCSATSVDPRWAGLDQLKLDEGND